MQHPLIKLQGFPGGSSTISAVSLFSHTLFTLQYLLVSEWLRQSCLPAPAALLMHSLNTN